MPFDGSDIYQLAHRLGLPDLERVAARAGVVSVWQVSAWHGERRLRHSVGRVIELQTGEHELQLAYEGVKLAEPIRHAVSEENMDKLRAVMLRQRFGKLGNQPGISRDERVIWLVQRAAGSHLHGILVAPDRPLKPWSAIVNAIDAYLPEAIREVPLRLLDDE